MVRGEGRATLVAADWRGRDKRASKREAQGSANRTYTKLKRAMVESNAPHARDASGATPVRVTCSRRRAAGRCSRPGVH